MAEVSESLTQLLDGQTDRISRRIGADEGQTRQAMHAAIPALLAALGDEAERGEGVKTAIRQDHDGAIIDQLSEYLGGNARLSPRTTNGAGILDHALGDRQAALQERLSAKSGLDMGSIGNLLVLLAPIVMGMLGKKSGSGGGGGGGGGFGLDDIGDLLNREKSDARGNPDIGDILDSFTGAGARRGGDSTGGLGDVLDKFGGGDRSR